VRLLITGLNGTLAPLLAALARERGHAVTGWDRAQVPPDDSERAIAWLEQAAPDAVLHLATGSAAWAGLLAGWAASRGRPLVFTSTAMVFHHAPDGPHRPADARTAQDDYGRSKIACEDAVLAAHAGASVARIGWQIDPAQPGNNMLLALDRWQQEQGEVASSRAWRPACSFMADTALALLALAEQPQPGVLHLDSNAAAGHSFHRIVASLALQFGRAHWRLRVHEDYQHDQRLVGGRVQLPPLAARLPQLEG
jgi:dTDP-4-dehydrorhamnose reductase